MTSSEVNTPCTWFDKKADAACGEPSDGWYAGHHACTAHLVKLLAAKTTAVRQQSAHYGPDEWPGICYVIQFEASGLIKIGMTATPATREDRFKRFRREFGEFTVLRELTGGLVTEAHLHQKFAADRVLSDGQTELFLPTPELLAFAASSEPGFIAAKAA